MGPGSAERETDFTLRNAGDDHPDLVHEPENREGRKPMKKTLLIVLVALACIHPFNWYKRIFTRVMLAGIAYATQVNFQWNASTGAVSWYKLYQGTVSGTYTTNVTIAGTGTTGSMDLDPSASRYVAATSYDAGSRESAFSNEILCHPVLVSASSGGSILPTGREAGGVHCDAGSKLTDQVRYGQRGCRDQLHAGKCQGAVRGCRDV
jgi:hypothetical protein